MISSHWQTSMCYWVLVHLWDNHWEHAYHSEDSHQVYWHRILLHPLCHQLHQQHQHVVDSLMNLSAPFMYSAAGQQLGTLDKDRQEGKWAWGLWTHLVLHIDASGSSLITFLKASGMHRSMKRLQFSSASASPGGEIDDDFMSSSQNGKKKRKRKTGRWCELTNINF